MDSRVRPGGPFQGPPFQQQSLAPPRPQSQHMMGPPPHQQHHGPPPPPPPPQQPQLTLRLILVRDEANYLFGFDGVLLDQLRQQTGASLFITEPLHEQVLTIQGSLELIFKAFSLICRKLWDFISGLPPPVGAATQQRPLVLRLAVPASQCGSIIGKHGAKVKEIRDLTGANVQVSQEGLPESTERCVEISGTGEACLQCAYHICCVMQDAPLRGEVIPYMPGRGGGGAMMSGGGGGGGGPGPDDAWKPVFLCGDKAYVIVEGGLAAPAPPELLRRELAKTPLGDMAESLATLSVNNFGRGQEALPATASATSQQPDYMNPLALMQAISSAQRQNAISASGAPPPPHTLREMPVAAEMVRFIIGKNGSKINEIRRISGAQLHIRQEEELTADERAQPTRMVTISGTQESILLAQFLVQSNIDMAVKDHGGGGGGGGGPPMPGGSTESNSIHQNGNRGFSGEARDAGGGRRFQNDPRRRNSNGTGGPFRR